MPRSFSPRAELDVTDEQAILDLEKRRCDLINAGDIDGIGVLLAEGYQHVHVTGAITGRSETLDRFRATPRRIVRGELTARVLGDAAVLVGTLDNHIPTAGGPDRMMRGVAMQLLRRSGSSWLFEPFQLTLTQG